MGRTYNRKEGYFRHLKRGEKLHAMTDNGPVVITAESIKGGKPGRHAKTGIRVQAPEAVRISHERRDSA